MISIYIHIPFCVKRCAYCDFITFDNMSMFIDDYVNSVCKEIEAVSNSTNQKLEIGTIYFGGGTPNILSISHYEAIFNTLHNQFNCKSNCEITMEVNPGLVNYQYLLSLTKLGINRFSIGVQSFNDFELRQLGRIHTVEDSIKLINLIHKTNTFNISFDLIFGLPEQNKRHWENTIINSLLFKPQHISAYSLIVEDNTPIEEWINKGKVIDPNQDIQADLYEYTIDKLSSAGYVHYEISNWSIRGEYESLHNKQYWLNLPYLGFGVAAHSSANHYRTENVKTIKEYIDLLSNNKQVLTYPKSAANINAVINDQYTEMQETMMLGLRLVKEGVSNKKFKNRYTKNILDIFNIEVEDLLGDNLIEWIYSNDDQRLRFTRRGLLLGNRSFMKFV